MNKELFKELAIQSTGIVMQANATSGEIGFNTAYVQEQWRYEFAKLVEQATLERAAKIAETCDLYEGDYLRNSDPRKTIAHEIRAEMYD